MDPKRGYKAGYATSKDGMNWTRLDNEVGLTCAIEGWDSEAIAYPYVLGNPSQDYLFYNGNGFGRTGMGYAVRSVI